MAQKPYHLRNEINTLIGLYAIHQLGWLEMKEVSKFSQDDETNEAMNQLITDIRLRLTEINTEHYLRNDKYLFDSHK